MKFRFFLTLLFCLVCGAAGAQTIKDASYRTVAHINSDGTVQDSGYRTIGHVKSDGTVQNASYHTIGHASGIPLQWVALYFFFSK